jgi:hypothetical protein
MNHEVTKNTKNHKERSATWSLRALVVQNL